MTHPAKDAIRLYRRSHDDVAQLVSEFRESDLQAQSGSTEWTVAQVLNHLGNASEIALRTLERGKADMGGNQAVWARWDAMSPTEQAANFVTLEGKLVSALEALSDDDLESKRIDIGFLPFPVDVGLFVDMRLSEVALHRWDVDVAFDRSARVPSYLVPAVLDRLPMFAGFFAKSIGKTGTVLIETVDPARNYLLELRDDGNALTEVDDPLPEAQTNVTMSGEALARLTAGRLSPEHTPEGISVAGSLDLEELRQLFPGF